MEEILNYTYRGVLKACNYNCRYCPFSKTAADAATIAADRKALFRFCDYIARLRRAPRSLQIFLLPYGEGMIHPHYTEALARLSRLPAVRRVSCQTNLSWNVDRFARTVTDAGGSLERIAFWCSFHPQCTTREAFIDQCDRLEQYGIRHCAGMVAVPGSEALAAEVRASLPAQTYLWLNRMDGLGRKYTPAETAAFRATDPFFPLELGDLAADASRCQGGKDSVFVRADGRTALCPVAGRYTGNIYRDGMERGVDKADTAAPPQACTAGFRIEAAIEQAERNAGEAKPNNAPVETNSESPERITGSTETGNPTRWENTLPVYPVELQAQGETETLTRAKNGKEATEDNESPERITGSTETGNPTRWENTLPVYPVESQAQGETETLSRAKNGKEATEDSESPERITGSTETGNPTRWENTPPAYPVELQAQGETETLIRAKNGKETTEDSKSPERITENTETRTADKNSASPTPPALRCNATRCACYLAYSNRPDTGLETFFGRGAFLRIPERKAVRNIFFDIDGTLTGENGELLPDLVPALTALSVTSRLYLATELPWIYARKKCGALLRFFAGGIFAGGAHIRFFHSGQNVYTYLPAETVTRTERLLAEYSVQKSAVKRYRTPAGVYRIAVTGRLPHELVTALSETAGVHPQAETGLVTLVSAATDKGKAVAYVLRQSGDNAGTALAVGNDTSDLAMFREVAYPVSVPGSPAHVTEASLGTLPVTLLPAFFGGSAGSDD